MDLEEDRLAFLLRTHGLLQERYIGKHPSQLTGDELIQYLKDMHLATESEAHEMLDEVDWKPWTPGNSVNYERAREEMIDELHFFLNRWLALGGTADMLLQMYLRKNEKNYRRILEGYDGKSTKCSECHTDLEELPADQRFQVVAYQDPVAPEGTAPLRFCNSDHCSEWMRRRNEALAALEGGGTGI